MMMCFALSLFSWSTAYGFFGPVIYGPAWEFLQGRIWRDGVTEIWERASVDLPMEEEHGIVFDAAKAALRAAYERARKEDNACFALFVIGFDSSRHLPCLRRRAVRGLRRCRELLVLGVLDL